MIGIAENPHHTRVTLATDGAAGALVIAAFFLTGLMSPQLRGQLLLDGTIPNAPGQRDHGVAVSNVPSYVKHPLLPLEVKIRDLYPVVAYYGDKITATLAVRNTSTVPLEIPCSRGLDSVSAEGAQDQRDFAAGLRLIEGKIPVYVVLTVFSGSSSVPGSMCTISPGGTLLIRGSGSIYGDPKLEDPRLAGTNLGARGFVDEFYYDDKHVLINYSQDSVSTDTVSIYYLGRRPQP